MSFKAVVETCRGTLTHTFSQSCFVSDHMHDVGLATHLHMTSNELLKELHHSKT